MKTLAVILAGGQSSRMGRDKAALPFGEHTMLTHLVEEYRTGFNVAVSVRTPGQFDPAGARELTDLHPGQGPLAGLEAAFLQTDAELVFLTATDLPFGRVQLARELLDRLGDSDACVIRRADGKIEPLFAVYRRSCLPALLRCLETGRRSCQALLNQLAVRWVEESELAGWDLEQLLQNVNTPEEYQKATGQALK